MLRIRVLVGSCRFPPTYACDDAVVCPGHCASRAVVAQCIPSPGAWFAHQLPPFLNQVKQRVGSEHRPMVRVPPDPMLRPWRACVRVRRS